MIIASLNPNHKADLLKSGLSEKTIQESGIHSISDPARYPVNTKLFAKNREELW